MTEKHCKFVRRIQRLVFTIAVVFAVGSALVWTKAFAETGYEFKLASTIHSILEVVIIGEFGGRTRENRNPNVHLRPCEPSDYEKLAAIAEDNAGLIGFRNECKFVMMMVDWTDPQAPIIHSIAFVPTRVCETLKSTFETILAKQVHAVPVGSATSLVVTYKGVSYTTFSSRRELLRGTKITASCRHDGALTLVAGAIRRPLGGPENCPVALAEYVRALDQLFSADLAKRAVSIDPYLTLNRFYFPIRGCTLDEVISVTSRSRFAEQIRGGRESKWVSFSFSNGLIRVGFSYLPQERKSEQDYASTKIH